MPRPKLPTGQKAVTKTHRFPPAKYKMIEAKAVEAGFVTKKGKPKSAVFIMYKCGVL